VKAGLAGLTGVLMVMWLTSYSFYTSFGVDTDRAEGSTVRSTLYRVRWPGDGSFRVGGGASSRALQGYSVEPFDLGGTFFQPPRRSTPRSFWNRIGFWWVDVPKAQEGVLLWTFWIGVPSWFLPLVAGAMWVLVTRARGTR
jgi:hypothetical protein